VVTATTIAIAAAVGRTLNGSIGYDPLPMAMALMAVLVARRDQRAAFAYSLVAQSSSFPSPCAPPTASSARACRSAPTSSGTCSTAW
jgi:hypothetical protein